jgi:hypothetical protein
MATWVLPELARRGSGDVFLTILWHIWKARNVRIFDQQTLPPPEVLRRAIKDLDDWSPRFRRRSILISAWRDFLFA